MILENCIATCERLKQTICKHNSWNYETNRKEHRESIQNIEIGKKVLEEIQKAYGNKSNSRQMGYMKLKPSSSKGNTWKQKYNGSKYLKITNLMRDQ